MRGSFFKKQLYQRLPSPYIASISLTIVSKPAFNRKYALDFLFQAQIAANTGTSSIFEAHHDGDMSALQKPLEHPSLLHFGLSSQNPNTYFRFNIWSDHLPSVIGQNPIMLPIFRRYMFI